jgi:hypothetical protein
LRLDAGIASPEHIGMRSKTICSLAVLGVLAVGFPGRSAVRAADPEPAAAAAAGTVKANVDHAALAKLVWQLAAETGTFHDTPLFETIDLLHAQVVHHLELEPGQSLSAAQPDVKVGPDMSAKDSDALLAKLKAVKMDVVSLGVVPLTAVEADDRKVFELGKKLKVKNILADAPNDALPLLDKLATEYAVNVVLVNQVKPATPSSIDELTAALAGRSKRIGVAVDVANFRRSGIDPVSAIKQLGPHILEIRLSDVNEQNAEVPLGTGTVNVAEVLKAAKAENFKSIVAVGYHTGVGTELANNFFTSVNAMSAQTTKLAQ